ncbi:fungal-specific transcription factor domain-containing protein [Truncatella angustata]|uniref:Fungal-specific transcription factor domain-containing protein n=1 Tax=Truncatella angustata TaxID=152316 RepID=A0A9P8RJE2_9PEZI|nr:fungal-specific transcription factor domain-containing protein [Truncatella angustata]KAH6647138.1 fungal-specific transcription factor domain-containing protein [Truncatella angustata]
MPVRCGICRYRGVRCDGARPCCSQCQSIGFACPGYTTTQRPSRDKVGVLARLHPDHVPDSMNESLVYDPVPELYNEAQIIFDGLHYFNDRVSNDLISIATHSNPYQVPLSSMDKIPRIYVNLLVTTAIVHRTMQEDPAFVRSSALVQREHDLYTFRLRALQEVNNRLSKEDTQTSDSTLMCVICLLLSTMQQSAYGDWRAHLEGARRIIQLRGGLKEVIGQNPFFKPLMAFFVAIDVMSATTAPSSHRHMYAATTMALHYWEAAPGIFQSNYAISAPCPEELFQVLILVNYLRAISKKSNLTSRRHAGTWMVLNKVQAFNAPQWAMKMKSFRGWKPSGDGVEFDVTTSGSGRKTPPLSRGQQAPRTSPTTTKHSTKIQMETNATPEPTALIEDLWLNIAVVYRSAIVLYAIRTLILDLPEDKDFLYTEDTPYLNLEALRLEHSRALRECLTPIFSDATNAHQFGKLVYFPMFVCGMELDQAEEGFQNFVAHGLETVGTACGTLGPISAADELRGYWAASVKKKKNGGHVTWDEWFEGKPDFIFGF